MLTIERDDPTAAQDQVGRWHFCFLCFVSADPFGSISERILRLAGNPIDELAELAYLPHWAWDHRRPLRLQQGLASDGIGVSRHFAMQNPEPPMSPAGQSRRLSDASPMSALAPTADVRAIRLNGRLVPQTEKLHCSKMRAYSITWSARPSGESGKVMPKDFAVLRLRNQLDFDGFLDRKVHGRNTYRHGWAKMKPLLRAQPYLPKMSGYHELSPNPYPSC